MSSQVSDNVPAEKREKKSSIWKPVKSALKKVSTPRSHHNKGEGKEGKVGSLFRNSVSSTGGSTPHTSTPSTPVASSSPFRGKTGEEDAHSTSSPLAEHVGQAGPRAAGTPVSSTSSSPVKQQEKADEVQGPPTPSAVPKEPLASSGDSNLATTKEDVPGGGTALPFGQQEGRLEGYNTTPDPQGEHYSKLVTEKTDINDSNLAATRPDNGGQGKKVILAILVATLAGAAGIYISGHESIRKDKSLSSKEHPQKKRFVLFG